MSFKNLCIYLNLNYTYDNIRQFGHQVIKGWVRELLYMSSWPTFYHLNCTDANYILYLNVIIFFIINLLWLLTLWFLFDLGIEGFCTRWRQFIQQLSGITGSIGLGIFSFKDSRIQQGRMLGSTKGGFTTYWWDPKGPPKFDPTWAMSRNLRVLLSTVEVEPYAVL